MSKKKFKLASLVLASALIFPTFASAEEFIEPIEAEKELTFVEAQVHSVNGESFNLEILNDGYVDYYSVTSDVSAANLDAVSEYVDELIKSKTDPFEGDEPILDDEGNVIQGDIINFARNLSNTDRSGKGSLSTSGYSEYAYLYPITSNKMRVNNGTINASFTGSGTANKIFINYNYKFNGTSASISFAPSLTRSSSTVSWKSASFVNTKSASARSLWAQATSRTLLTSTNIRGGAEVYKGSVAYRPDYSSTVGWMNR
ncbi:hypothetical protein [Cytobacillus purgationiresistens]|uniref:DUF5626 domain-containing protein n=1 Tax=Cytobacillus purgationiresistens TaxID=863449 RepID=A0ABU0ART4_9BACI|nr:hypothetical protein [Cytobacillus purgationiresistens]MDQ0273962.1 hypothetical protein [Cytobacillus purgationiresistens]